jgi:hypothetical protein
VGRGQTGASLPANLPATVVATVERLVHDVFVNGYVIAMRPTVGVAVAVLAVASLTCLLVINRRRVLDEAAAPADVALVG